jgi:multiple antibiotic resistance protein
MHQWLGSALQFSFVTFSSIFFLVDPFAAIPAFLAMTIDENRCDRRRLARRAAITCFLVLTAFAFAGTLIFKIFGITLPAFRIAGGLILLLIGLEMLQAHRSHTQEVPAETQEGAEKDDIGVIPMGIPMLAGPGAISTVMVQMGQSIVWWRAAVVLGSIALTAVVAYGVLAGAERVRKVLGETGIRILMRMMGLLLTAIAVQFVVNGLMELGVIPKTVS